jgi:hypothetical protein
VETARGKSREEIITKVAARIDAFERYRQPHSALMADLACQLAKLFRLSGADTLALEDAALLHDIGLYGISPAYLTSLGPLSSTERMDLWRHPVVGEQQMARRNASRHSQLLVRWHHEWWNGSGYPDALSFEDIPVGARILRAVELYSALISDRPHRDAYNQERAFEMLRASAGIECDPYVVKALLTIVERPENTDAVSLDMHVRRFASPVIQPAALVADTQPPPLAADTQPPDDPEPITMAEYLSEPYAQAPPFPRDGESDLVAATAQSNPEDDTQAETRTDTAASTAEFSSSSEQGVGGLPPPADEPGLAPNTVAPPDDEVEKEAREAQDASPAWMAWKTSCYNEKQLVGFQASVLGQIDFKCIAIPVSGWGGVITYLKAWGRAILANDPRSWAAACSRARLEGRQGLEPEQVSAILDDVYVPSARLANPGLRRWFSETDAWFMDNLRRNIDRIADPAVLAQALLLGIQTGDYAQSFEEETLELKRPLTTIFRQLAEASFDGFQGHSPISSYNLPVEEFIQTARADLLYLNLPAGNASRAGSAGRHPWRECWVSRECQTQSGKGLLMATIPQSRPAYLSAVNRLLTAGIRIRKWAIECQETGLASARDISDLIKNHRTIRTTYVKDLTEVAGGLRNYIILAESA